VNKTALPIIHLIDVMKPGFVDFSMVKQGSMLTDEVRIRSKALSEKALMSVSDKTV
jgi:hypothetical protein